MKRSVIVALALLASPLLAQDAVSPTQGTNPPVANRSGNRDLFPNINLYLPEGEVDLRARKLIRNVLFESQINYEFVNGNVSTFLRYKYYARDFTYKLSVFDTIEFSSVQSGSRDFDRVRGGLLLFELPANYNHRYFFLTQLDGLTFGDVARADNGKNNLFVKLGYQQGTPFDERLNSIVGESRGRITPVLTAFRDIGPQKVGFAAALTQGIDKIGGDFRYTKLESEILKRSDVSENTFLVSRLHVGSMLQKTERGMSPSGDPYSFSESFSVPRYEMFRIGGRDALKGISSKSVGTDEAHLSNEYFFPIFRNKNHRLWGSHWTNMYGITYAGVGSCRCDAGRTKDVAGEKVSRLSDIVADAGLGMESSVTVRDYDIYLSVLYAQTVHAPDNLKGHEVRFAIRTSR